MLGPEQFGVMERLKVRDYFANEANDFTPWLSADTNIKILGDALGLELEVEGSEENVGPYRADILCVDLSDNSKVLIENQLEKSDHIHLGQLLTYAAGLETVTIIWVAVRFTDEHIAAMEWLNEITNTKFRFFALEFELWKIGDSRPAPKFNVVCQPNDWQRSLSHTGGRQGNLSDLNKRQLTFWLNLRASFSKLESPLRTQTPRPQHWTNLSVGKTGFQLAALTNSQSNTIGVGFETTSDNKNGKAYFDLLLADKQEIEDELGFSADWDRLDVKQATRISYHLPNAPLTDSDKWDEYIDWMHTHLLKLHEVFSVRIKNLDLSNWVDPGDAEEAGE